MKYRVIGSNKDTGARMILEMEADSKAAAERRAMQTGMYVTRVEDASVYHEDVGAPRRVSRGRSGGIGWVLQIIIGVAIAAAAWHYWPQIKAMLGKG